MKINRFTCTSFSSVSFSVKAILLHETAHLTDKLKQDIIVADATGTAKLTLWEDNVNSLEQGHSYKLVDYVVRIW